MQNIEWISQRIQWRMISGTSIVTKAVRKNLNLRQTLIFISNMILMWSLLLVYCSSALDQDLKGINFFCMASHKDKRRNQKPGEERQQGTGRKLISEEQEHGNIKHTLKTVHVPTLKELKTIN